MHQARGSNSMRTDGQPMSRGDTAKDGSVRADRLKVLMISAEVAPYAKVGGLADVVGSLPLALAAAGHEVVVAMPRYGGIDPARYQLTPPDHGFMVTLGWDRSHGF